MLIPMCLTTTIFAQWTGGDRGPNSMLLPVQYFWWITTTIFAQWTSVDYGANTLLQYVWWITTTICAQSISGDYGANTLFNMVGGRCLLHIFQGSSGSKLSPVHCADMVVGVYRTYSRCLLAQNHHQSTVL